MARDRRRRTPAISSSGSAVEVGLFGLQTITSRVATVISVAHRVEVVRVRRRRAGPRSRARPRRPRGAGRREKRRPRVDELGARLEQRLAGGEQDVAGAVADRDPAGRARRSGRDSARAQRGVRRVRVAVERRRATFVTASTTAGSGGYGDSLEASIATGPSERVAVGGGIDGDAADRCAELDRPSALQATARRCRSSRSARASPR